MSDQEWIDKFAIQELIYCHSDAITRGDLSALESLYAPDATWEHPAFGLRFESARAFLDYTAEGTATLDSTRPDRAEPRRAPHRPEHSTATTTMFELNRGTLAVAVDGPLGAQGEEVNIGQYGVYYDDFSKTTGQWLFTHRLFALCALEQDAVRGDLLTPRSSLLAP